jgi:hypothetical protein
MAAPFDGTPTGGDALQDVLDGITTNPFHASNTDVYTDMLADNMDSTWAISAAGGSVTTFIIELAGYASITEFGIYDSANPGKTEVIFSGAAIAGDQALVSIKADGSVFINFMDTGTDFAGNSFGFFLDSTLGGDLTGDGTPDGGFFYSDTTLNSDQGDHMYAYQGQGTDTVQLPGFSPGIWGSNEYILAFEDWDFTHGSDRDFTDMVLMIESVSPVPVPGAVLLGILGLSAAGIKLRRFA